MVEMIRFCANHRRRIGGRETMAFAPDYSVIVGPNGSGKSTVLQALTRCDRCQVTGEGDIAFHDAVLADPRHAVSPRSARRMQLKLRGMFSSHGQIAHATLSSLEIGAGATLLLDEPESGQDFEHARQLRGVIDRGVARGIQVIAASHHPAFWERTRPIELCSGYAEQVLEGYRSLETGVA